MLDKNTCINKVYSSESASEPDVDLENQYYNSKALKEDNWERARSIHAPLAKLISYQTTLDAYVAVEKYLLVKQGIFTSTRQRGPVGFILSDEMKVEIDIGFDQLKAAVDKK